MQMSLPLTIKSVFRDEIPYVIVVTVVKNVDSKIGVVDCPNVFPGVVEQHDWFVAYGQKNVNRGKVVLRRGLLSDLLVMVGLEIFAPYGNDKI